MTSIYHLRFECQRGFELIGIDELFCWDGIWVTSGLELREYPFCEKIICKDFDFRNGTVNISDPLGPFLEYEQELALEEAIVNFRVL